VRQAVAGFRGLRSPRLSRHTPLVKKTVVTVVVLLALYWGVTSVIAYITAPRLEMTMSPVVGPIAVVAEPAKVAVIERRVTYTGSVAPFQEVTVYPRAEGWVTRFQLYEGDHVRQGQVIARLDRSELGASVAEAQSRVARTEARVAQAEAGLLQAKADMEYIEAELGRDMVLVKGNAISQSAFDLRKSQAAVARSKIAAQQEALAAAKAEVAEARENLKRRNIILNYTDVEAPISGRVSKRHIYAGILVKPGMPIVDLQDLSRIRVQVRVAEPDLPFVRVGTPAVIRFSALSEPNRERRAQVTTVFPQLDPASRTATVEMLMDNPGELIKPDMYAVVDLVLERKDKALTIPREAVLDGPDGKPIVYVTDAVTATSRPVKVGIAERDRVEVLDGLKEGEMVVAKGQRTVSEGAQVNVVPQL